MNKGDLQDIIAGAVDALGFEFLGYEQHNQPKRQILRIYVDKPTGTGVTLGDCEQISRHLGATLDVEATMAGRYNLEVSSPGVERRLFIASHYARFVGHTIKLKLRIPCEEGRRHYSGVIQEVSDDRVTLKADDQVIVFLLSEIERANLSVELGKDRCSS